jgi:SAM-dependent methyltransferase
MFTHEYSAMFELEDVYWWYVGRRRLVEEIVKKESAKRGRRLRILDVGCGTGATLSALSKFGDAQGVDISEEAVRFCSERNLTAELHPVEHLQFPDSAFDVVAALDVLEHTDDDLVALRELNRVCGEGALLLITVPAYGFLWSEHDEALQHRRRYTAHELRNKLTTAGFVVERSTYFITLLFAPILLFRIYQGLTKKSVEPRTSIKVLPKWINRCLEGILAFEQFVMRFINLPFGVSIVALARPMTSAQHQQRLTTDQPALTTVKS